MMYLLAFAALIGLIAFIVNLAGGDRYSKMTDAIEILRASWPDALRMTAACTCPVLSSAF